LVWKGHGKQLTKRKELLMSKTFRLDKHTEDKVAIPGHGPQKTRIKMAHEKHVAKQDQKSKRHLKAHFIEHHWPLRDERKKGPKI
jgi:hypothetical protein